MKPYAVHDQLDWDRFAARQWNRQPVLIKGTSASPFRDADVFAAAVQAGITYLSPSFYPGEQRLVRFSVGRKQPTFLRPWLPVGEDGSTAGYSRRVLRALKGERYGLTLSSFHASWFPLWAAEKAFLAQLWARVGIPQGNTITTLFHGNYEHSAVGVHLDRFSTFLFCVSGSKRMRFWRRKPWSAPVSTCLDYAPYLKDSFAVQVDPGDILYWPSTYFHVGETVGDAPATSVNIGIPSEAHRLASDVDDLFLGGLEGRAPGGEEDRLNRIPSALGRAFEPRALAADGRLRTALPEAMRRAVRAYREVSERAEMEHHLRVVWSKRISAGGIEPVPPPAPLRSLKRGERLRPVPGAMVWSRSRGGWICAANGHALELPASPLVSALREGRDVRVEGARQRHVLEQLLSFRALGPVP